jgi:predicted trehalose synthase
MAGADILPEGDDLRLLFDVFSLEKALHEVVFELRHRPEMVRIPLLAVLERLGPNEGDG